MTDPYASLARQLAAAARRQEGRNNGSRFWMGRLRRGPAVVIAVVLVLVGGAAAVAASGLLEGAPVKPEAGRSAVHGNGLPLGKAGGLAVRTVDPSRGLSWGMRVVHTTRGQVCVQVGRVDGSRLGELGTDSAFGDDGRFHALSASVLPPGYGGSSGQVECIPSGRTLIAEDAYADSNAVRLLPEEFPELRGAQVTPPTANLRTLAYGLLGPHALSVTYRTPAGLHTAPVHGPEGSFLIVEPGGYVNSPTRLGVSVLGEASSRSVDVTAPVALDGRSIVTAVAFRFGSRLCSEGVGSPVRAKCPSLRPNVRRTPFASPRDLHRKIELTLLAQSPAACRAAYLLDPCYKGQLEFRAPYAVTSATSDYEIRGFARCTAGGRPETGWSLERDVKAQEIIRTTSLGLFALTPNCLTNEGFEVRYGPAFAARPSQGSVIVGKVRLSEATARHGSRRSR